MSKTITGADGKEYIIEPNADLSEANLSGSLYNSITKFHDGFDYRNQLERCYGVIGPPHLPQLIFCSLYGNISFV